LGRCRDAIIRVVEALRRTGGYVPLSRDNRKHYWLKRLLPVVLVLFLGLVFLLDRVFFPAPMQSFQQRREMMDTWVTITVYDRDPDRATQAMEASFSRMEKIESIASIYDERAEAYALNQQGSLDDPSPELIEIVEAALKTSALSGGAFDVTVEPLLELWRYEPGADRQFWELESAEQQGAISEAMALVGPDRISVTAGPAIVLAPGSKITLGGIAKGYAVDQGLEALREAGIKHGLIDAGGDIGALGGKPDNEPWEIVLRNPNDSADFLVRFGLTDGAIATSGNYERYFDPAAEVGHIMDPRTGFSAHNASSVTVIAPTCTQADALATAVFVLGPVDGIALVKTLEAVEAFVVGYKEPSRLYRSEGLGAFEQSEKGGL